MPGQVTPDLQGLARRAQSGDKQAQFDLGYLYETGRGMSRDIDRAQRLYRLAASESGGTIWVYTPSPGNGAQGRVNAVDRGSRQIGLKEAKTRLKILEGPERSE